MSVTEAEAVAALEDAPEHECDLSGLDEPGVDWIGHDESRPATWALRLISPPAIPRWSRIEVCDECKAILTGELLEVAARSFGSYMECTIIGRI